MRNAQKTQLAESFDTETESAFDVRFRNLLAEMSEQDAAVESLLAAQGVDRDDLDGAQALPDSIADQLADVADERIQAERRQQAPRLSNTFSAFALRA